MAFDEWSQSLDWILNPVIQDWEICNPVSKLGSQIGCYFGIPKWVISCIGCSIGPYTKYIQTVGSDTDCKNTNYSAQHRVLCAHVKYFIYETAKKFYFYYLTHEKVKFQLIFVIPKIPGLRRRQSWDSRLVKKAGILGFGILGWQSPLLIKCDCLVGFGRNQSIDVRLDELG